MRYAGSSPISAVAVGKRPDSRCPFCFPAAIAPNQLLATTEHFYLLAPAGQLIEGFLGIMTHACRDEPVRLRCLDDIHGEWVGELLALRDLVSDFYRDVYRLPALFYEHGRGGGYRSSPPGGDFVFHPHLCALPGDLDVHEVLQARFQHRPAGQFSTVRSGIGRRPYLYVHTPERPQSAQPVVYYGAAADSAECVSGLSLKRMLAETYSIDRDSDWRQYPGERELVELVDKFNHWYATGFRRRADPRFDTIFAGGPHR